MALYARMGGMDNRPDNSPTNVPAPGSQNADSQGEAPQKSSQASPPVSPNASSSPANRPLAPGTGSIDTFSDPSYAHLPELKVSDLHFRPQRKRLLPLGLFIATCLSTFWVGAARWNPSALGDFKMMWLQISTNWVQGLAYMGAVLAILLTHEMGHFLQTIKHRIPASFPLCIPLPINPFGTMGAVIGMDGTQANRKQIFDIGIAGPLAGLVVAIPIMWYGVTTLNPAAVFQMPPDDGKLYLHCPLIVQWMMQSIHPQWLENSNWVRVSQVNPYFMAGWVGMLITGLNMMPISQLDGGHTVYALFGKDAHTISRGFLIFAILFVVIYFDQAFVWAPMLIFGYHHRHSSPSDRR